MQLLETLAAAGMTPPREIAPGRWMRFPGVGKGRSNRSGWCRLITPTLAIYGDWSSNLSATWTDTTHRDTEDSRRLLQQARERERRFQAEQRRRQREVAREAARRLAGAIASTHPYLSAKGFPHAQGLVCGDRLLIPVRDVQEYAYVMSIQEISPEGVKRFMPGGRTRGGVYRFGGASAVRTVLCEGYATGLTLNEALSGLHHSHAVIVCFSAYNLTLVAENYRQATVCADNDASEAGEQAARATGLPWAMPPETDTDFNDWHQRDGIYPVREALRRLFA